MNTVTVMLIISIAAQVTAAILALRLIAVSGRAIAWLLFSIVFILMAARRSISLLHEVDIIADPHELAVLIEPVALIISFLLVIAVFLIRFIFQEHNKAREQLEQQLEELRRFHKLTVGRELRMKELKEENARLKAQIRQTSSGNETEY